MSKCHYIKDCPGCAKQFKRNRSRKTHILVCEKVPDDERIKFMNERMNYPEFSSPDQVPKPTMSPQQRAEKKRLMREAKRAHEKERRDAHNRVSAAGIRHAA